MLAFLLVLFAQAAPQKGLTLRDLQERARKNDPRAMQAVAQLENAQGKHDEASWAWFPNFQTTAYVGGPTQEHRLLGADLHSNPSDRPHPTPGIRGAWLH